MDNDVSMRVMKRLEVIIIYVHYVMKKQGLMN
jgi:hypothetical protein